MNKRTVKIGVVALVLGVAAGAFAQQSEYQNKLQEDLDYYKPQLVNNCGVAEGIKISYVGKLAGNPRERQSGEKFSVSTMCGFAMDAMVYSCQTSEPVKKTLAKLKSVVCTPGHGTINYKLGGAEMTVMIDPTYDNPKSSNSPKEDLVAKLKHDLDK